MNEADNVGVLISELNEYLSDIDAELVFVDDSTDETPQAILSQVGIAHLPIELIHRRLMHILQVQKSQASSRPLPHGQSSWTETCNTHQQRFRAFTARPSKGQKTWSLQAAILRTEAPRVWRHHYAT